MKFYIENLTVDELNQLKSDIKKLEQERQNEITQNYKSKIEVGKYYIDSCFDNTIIYILDKSDEEYNSVEIDMNCGVNIDCGLLKYGREIDNYEEINKENVIKKLNSEFDKIRKSMGI